ncbi:polymorphic outer membrane protein, partial [Chlamydia psittaci C6/98]
HTHTI